MLDDDVDGDRVRTDVVTAVRAGGDLVHFAHDRGSTDALITPASRVRFDYRAAPPPDLPADADVNFIDFNLDDL